MNKIKFFCIGLLFSAAFGAITAYGCEQFMGNQYVDCYLEYKAAATDQPHRGIECHYGCYCKTGNESECDEGMSQLGLDPAS